jgi:Carboxylesterase family
VSQRTKEFTSLEVFQPLKKKETNASQHLTSAGGGLLSSEDSKQYFQENTLEALRYLLTIPDHPEALFIAQKALDQYLSKDQPFAEQMGDLEKVSIPISFIFLSIELDFVQMVSDWTFFKCIDDVVRMQISHDLEPIYYYMDSYRSQFSFIAIHGTSNDYGLSTGRRNVEKLSSFLNVLGVCHGDDLLMLFTNKLVPPLTTDEDKRMSKMFVDLWTSFAVQGLAIPKSYLVL